jgi:hypothetical protein
VAGFSLCRFEATPRFGVIPFSPTYLNHAFLQYSRSQYLAGILTILEQTGCPNYPFASTSNGWTTAFHNVYATVALDCHHPVGKNRHHKFKDKMVEIWIAIEAEVVAGRKNPELSPVVELGLRQLERYRTVTRDTEETRKIPRGGTVTAKIGASADGSANVEVPVPAAVVAEAQATPPPGSPGPKDKPAAEGAAATAARKQAPSAAPAVAAAALAVPAAATAAAIAAPERIPLPRRARPRHLKNLSNSASTKGPTTRESLVRIEDRLRRLEAVAFPSFPGPGSGSGSTLFARAPESTLGMLHHLWLQHRASAAHPDRARHAKRIKPHYEGAIREYLSQLERIVTAGADPDDLFAALLDLDALLRAHDLESLVDRSTAAGNNDQLATANGGGKASDDVGAQIREAYKRTLDAYLKLINPDLAEEDDDDEEEVLSDAEESSGHRPSRKRPADEAMGGNDTEGDRDEDGEEDDGDEDDEDGDVVNV